MVSGDDATEVPGSEIHSDGDEYFASHFGGEDSSGNDSDSGDEYSDEDLPRRSSQQYSTDPRGFTPLMEAAVKGTVADIRALIQAGVDVNEGRQGRITALHIAAETGNELVLAALIRAGGNVNAWLDDGSAPLHCAAVHGHVEVVEALICAGAKLDDVRDSTYTPLFLAAAEGHGAVVVALLNAGAKLNAAIFQGGCTPLMIAAQEGQTAAVAALLGAGAEVDKTDDEGCTALHRAAHNNHLSVIMVLVEAGAKVDKGKNDGATRRLMGPIAALASPVTERERTFEDGSTPLCLAAKMGNEAVVAALLGAGGDVNLARFDGCTPLSVAAHEGREAMVLALLMAGAEVSKAKSNGWTPLHFATQEGHKAVAELLHSWTLAREDPVQRYFLRFSKLPTNLSLVDPRGCSLHHLPAEVVRIILTKPPCCRLLSHQDIANVCLTSKSLNAAAGPSAVAFRGVESSDCHVRMIAFAAVSRLVCDGKVTPQHAAAIFATRLQDVDWNVRRASILALGDLGTHAAPHAGAIAKRLEVEDMNGNRSVQSVLGAAIQALVKVGEHAAPHAAARLDHAKAHVRAAALRVLGGLGARASPHAAAIAARLKDDDETVREAAAFALMKLHSHS